MRHEQRPYGLPPREFRLPDSTQLGGVRLQVSDLDHSLAYYQRVLGCHLLERDAGVARLGAEGSPAVWITLEEVAGTRPVTPGTTPGLYHFALLLPTRADLGRFVTHLVGQQLRFGSADHTVSESLYLWDPDGLGIEVYADRPRHTWRAEERELQIGTLPLDLRSLVDDGADDVWRGLPAGTTMGHLHLSVGDLERARDFYHHGLGFDLMMWRYPGALFMSAGGYHHHLGTNTWAVTGRVPGPQDARLLEWDIWVPDAADVDAACASLRSAGFDAAQGQAADPWGSRLRLRATSSP